MYFVWIIPLQIRTKFRHDVKNISKSSFRLTFFVFVRFINIFIIFDTFFREERERWNLKIGKRASEHNHKLFVIRANILHHWSSRLLLKFKLHEIQRTWKFFLWGENRRRKERRKKVQNVSLCHFLQFSASFYLLANTRYYTEHYGLKIMIFFPRFIIYIYFRALNKPAKIYEWNYFVHFHTFCWPSFHL